MKLVSLKRSCIALSVLAVCAGSLTACKHKHSGAVGEYKVQVLATANSAHPASTPMHLGYTQGDKDYTDTAATTGTFAKTYAFADNNPFILSSISYSTQDGYTCKLNNVNVKFAIPSSPAAQIIVGPSDWTCTSTKSLAHEKINIVDANGQDIAGASVKLTSSAGSETANDSATVDLTPGTYTSEPSITVDGIQYSFKSSDPTTLTATADQTNTWTLTYKKGTGPVSHKINLNVTFTGENATSYAKAYASSQDSNPQAKLTDTNNPSATYDFSNFVASDDRSVTAIANSITQTGDKFKLDDKYPAPSGCKSSISGSPAGVGNTITETFNCSAPPAPPVPVNPTGDNNKKVVIYMMSQDIGGLTTVDSSKPDSIALFPAGYTSTLDGKQLANSCQSAPADAFCKMINTKNKIDGSKQSDVNNFYNSQADGGKTDVILNLAFEKPHTLDAVSSISSMTMTEFDTDTGFSFPTDMKVADVQAFVKDLEANGIYVFNSVGGWDYSNPVEAGTASSNSDLEALNLVDVYHQGLVSDGGGVKNVTNKYAETVWDATGTVATIDYTKDKAPTAGYVKSRFDFFPNPAHDICGKTFEVQTSSISNPEGVDPKDCGNATQTIQNWFTLAKQMGVSGVDLDYEETWYADLNAVKVGNMGSFIAPRSAEKFGAIMQEFDKDAQAAKLATSTATVPVADANITDTTNGNLWWKGNLKGIGYMASLDKNYGSSVKTAYGHMDHIGVMTYDADTDTMSSYCPTPAGYDAALGKADAGSTGTSLCDLKSQVTNYLTHWKKFESTMSIKTPIIGGLELGQPAYPQPYTEGGTASSASDTNCNIPLKSASQTDCGTLAGANNYSAVSDILGATPKGVILWELNKGFTFDGSGVNGPKAGNSSGLSQGGNVAAYSDFLTDAAHVYGSSAK